MEGALAIRLAALGVAVCSTGLLMVGLTRAVGGLALTGDEAGEDIVVTGEVEDVVTAVEAVAVVTAVEVVVEVEGEGRSGFVSAALLV